MKKYHFHYCHWTWSEILLYVTMSPFSWLFRQKLYLYVIKQLGKYYPGSSLYLVDSGRTALTLILRAMKIEKPDHKTIIVPTYICPAVLKCIEMNHLSPVFIDIDTNGNLDTNQLSALSTDRTLAIIAVHNYGSPCNIEYLEEFTKKRNIFLIDDAAQVIGIKNKDRFLGNYGDAGLVSCAQSKTLVNGESGSGGIAIIKNPSLKHSIEKEFQKMRIEEFGAILDFFEFLFTMRLEQFTQWITHQLSKIIKPAPHKIWPRKMATLNLFMVFTQLKKLQKQIERKCEITALYESLLKPSENKITLRYNKKSPYISRLFINFASHHKLKRLRQALKNEGIQTRTPYPLDSSIQTSDFPQTHAYLENLIEIPSDLHLTAQDIQDISKIILKINNQT